MRRTHQRGALASSRSTARAGAGWLQHRRPRRPRRREDTSSAEEPAEEATGDSEEWFVQADFDEQNEQRAATFEGDEAEPWLQYIDGEMTDTSEYKSDGAKKVCFANASVRTRGARPAGSP